MAIKHLKLWLALTLIGAVLLGGSIYGLLSAGKGSSAAARPVPKPSHTTSASAPAPQKVLTQGKQHTNSGAFTAYNDTFPEPGLLPNQQAMQLTGPGSFKVTQSSTQTWGSENTGFPCEIYGSHAGLHSPSSVLPAPASSVRLQSDLNVTAPFTGKYSAGYDMWLTSHGQPAAEIMIWLNERGFPTQSPGTPPPPVVTIDGQQFYVYHWITGYAGKQWQYIQFRAVHRVDSAHISVPSFLQYTQAQGLTQPDWSLQNVAAGFELWYGGVGMAINHFDVRNG